MDKRLVMPGDTRQPNLRLLIAGKTMPGLLDVETTVTSHFQAGNWACRIALDAYGGQDIDWWGQDARKGELWDLRIDVDGSEQSLMTGEADRLRLDVAAGTIAAQGRDLTARFIEASTQEAFQNRTASEIAGILAARHGMTAVVDPTTNLVSRYYGADHDRVTHDHFSRVSREWDLLKHLAEFEGYDLFVVGTELHFQKPVDPSQQKPYRVQWDRDARTSEVVRIGLERSLTQARDVVVKVRVWASGKAQGFTQYSPPNGRGLEREGKATIYAFTRPNLTPDQAQQLADGYRDQITRYQRTLSLEVPGELTLTPRDLIKVDGVGDGWGAQPFFVTSIRRELTFDRGFTMRIEGRNSDPLATAST